MIAVQIPGYGDLKLQHLVLDYNGTIAQDGRLLPGVGEVLKAFAEKLQIHVVTGDTFGLAARELDGLPVRLTILPPQAQAEAKRDYVAALEADRVVAIGNGANDHKMLCLAALGILVLGREGAAAMSANSASIVATSITAALELLQQPKRLIATLRS